MPRASSLFKTHCVDTLTDFNALVETLKHSDSFAFDLETTSLDTRVARIVGVALCHADDTGYYIPVGHARGTNLDVAIVLKKLTPLLQNPAIQKIGHNLKYDLAVLHSYEITVENIWDTLLAGYLLRKGIAESALDLGTLARNELHYTVQPIEDLIGPRGPAQRTFDHVDIPDATFYAAEDAVVAWRLKQALEPHIHAENLQTVLNTIELPLIPILVRMEATGMKINPQLLVKMSSRTAKDLTKLTQEIFAIAGCEWNLNSPKQLAAVLYGTLKLPTKNIKRTKTGFSTASSELEKLDHPIAQKLMAFRELDKLKSTYLDTLPTLIHEKTGRVHSSFNQAITATGRLSSSNPNLQNIPTRTDIGRNIRKAFIADRGYSLVAADYSQIELRILAHLSDDETLIDAFTNKIDIHAKTASLVEKVPLDKVTDTMRSAAKVVNFGILYGLGPNRLSRETNLSLEEARAFIDGYFSGYPGVKKWIEDTKKAAYAQGFTETLFGRRRYIPELHSPEGYLRSFGERMAVNMPVQGTAADIMKLAMIAVDRALQKYKLRSRMILQVHDELLIETPASEIQSVQDILSTEMSNFVSLKVPLTIEIAVGKNWGEMD